MPDAARAMAELKAILAATQHRVWQASPREMQPELFRVPEGMTAINAPS